MFCDAGGRSSFGGRDVRTNLFKVPDSTGIPFYSHLGGGFLRFDPKCRATP
jgi:hypothetical protein